MPQIPLYKDQYEPGMRSPAAPGYEAMKRAAGAEEEMLGAVVSKGGAQLADKLMDIEMRKRKQDAIAGETEAWLEFSSQMTRAEVDEKQKTGKDTQGMTGRLQAVSDEVYNSVKGGYSKDVQRLLDKRYSNYKISKFDDWLGHEAKARLTYHKDLVTAAESDLQTKAYAGASVEELDQMNEDIAERAKIFFPGSAAEQEVRQNERKRGYMAILAKELVGTDPAQLIARKDELKQWLPDDEVQRAVDAAQKNLNEQTAVSISNELIGRYGVNKEDAYEAIGRMNLPDELKALVTKETKTRMNEIEAARKDAIEKRDDARKNQIFDFAQNGRVSDARAIISNMEDPDQKRLWNDYLNNLEDHRMKKDKEGKYLEDADALEREIDKSRGFITDDTINSKAYWADSKESKRLHRKAAILREKIPGANEAFEIVAEMETGGHLTKDEIFDRYEDDQLAQKKFGKIKEKDADAKVLSTLRKYYGKEDAASYKDKIIAYVEAHPGADMKDFFESMKGDPAWYERAIDWIGKKFRSEPDLSQIEAAGDAPTFTDIVEKSKPAPMPEPPAMGAVPGATPAPLKEAPLESPIPGAKPAALSQKDVQKIIQEIRRGQ